MSAIPFCSMCGTDEPTPFKTGNKNAYWFELNTDGKPTFLVADKDRFKECFKIILEKNFEYMGKPIVCCVCMDDLLEKQ